MLGLFEPKLKEDPLFGLVRFRRQYSFFGAGFWESKLFFKPIGEHLEVCVFAEKSGISQAQRNFYQELEQRFDQFIDATYDVLLETPLKNWGNDFFGKIMPELDRRDFKLERIFIPNLEKPDAQLGLSFHYLPMEDDSYTVYFDNWKPIYGEMDEWKPLYGKGD